ncbi:hypothetical protein ACXVRB_09965 (plasmid) [Limosilactobacillus ingluviei]
MSKTIPRTLIDQDGQREIKQGYYVGAKHQRTIKQVVADKAERNKQAKDKPKRKLSLEEEVLEDAKALQKALDKKPTVWRGAVDRSTFFQLGEVKDPLFHLPLWPYDRRLPRLSELLKDPLAHENGGVIMDERQALDQFLEMQEKIEIHRNKKIYSGEMETKILTAPRDSARAVQSHRGKLPLCAPGRPGSKTDFEDVVRMVDYVLCIFDLLTKSKQKAKPEKQDKKKKDPILRLLVSIDTEWEVHTETTTADDNGDPVPVPRDPSDVLNVSVAMRLLDDPEQKPYVFTIVNQDPCNHRHPGDPNSAFNLKQTIITIYEEALRHYTLSEELEDAKKIDMLLTGYFLGVDFSALTGWNLIDPSLIVKGKHYIASTRPYKLYLHTDWQYRQQRKWRKDHPKLALPPELEDIVVSLTIRDAGLLADKGGLKSLAAIVGVPKLDTEEDDRRSGKPIGYYKQHMAEYLKDHPSRYFKYVTNDALIPLLYLDSFVKTFSDKLSWDQPVSKFPMTTSSFAAVLVSDLLKADPSQSIFDPKVKLSDRRLDPVGSVRRDLLPLYTTAVHAFFGGFNGAFCSAVGKGLVVDLDLTSAYNTAGSMMPVPTYAAPRSNRLEDLGSHCVAIDSPTGMDFRDILPHLRELKGYPFILGAATADISMPADCKITMVPSESPVYHSPAYVRQMTKIDTTIVDLIAAADHGAKIKVYHFYAPAQRWEDYNAWAMVQLQLRSKRDLAKKLRNEHQPGDALYTKHDGEQQTFKLVGNTIFGKSAQGVIGKRVRSYVTGEVSDMTISSITDPVIAGAYTAITRMLAWYLYDAVDKVCGDGWLPLNITTDGLSLVLQPDTVFDFDRVHDVFLAHLTDHYKNRLAKIGAKYGFERKRIDPTANWDATTRFFNLRTRFNATVDAGILEALGGIRYGTYTVAEVYQAICEGKIWLPVRDVRLTNLTEMKFGSLNHRQGLLSEFPTLTRISLQYDCAYKPSSWLDDKWDGFGFTAVPFDTMTEHDEWKAHSKELSDRWNISRTKDRFEAYLETMRHYSFRSKRKLDDLQELSTMRELLTVSKAGSGYPTDQKLHDRYKRFKVAVRDDKPWPVCSMAIYDQNHDLD